MLTAGTRRKILGVLGYAAFFLVAFLFFCYLTFPYGRLRDYLVQQVAEAQKGDAGQRWKLNIGEVGPHWFTGVSLDDVRIERPADEPDEPATTLSFDEVKLGTSLLALVAGKTSVDFETELGDGEMEGEYSMAGSEGPTSMAAELEDVDVEKLGLGGFLGIPLRGRASGTLDVTLAKDPAQTHGAIDLRIEDLEIGDGKAKVPLPGMSAGLTLDTIQAGTLELRIAIEEGIAALDELKAEGKDVELSGSGSLRLLQPLSRSRPDITLGIKIADAYKSKSSRTKAAFDLMDNSPQIKRATAPDGTLRFRLVGSLRNLRAKPAGPARRPGPKR